jgi:cytoskeletal protein CcmA (bactofilin family)
MATSVVDPEISTTPASSGAGSSSSWATIGKTVTISGDVSSNEDLYVDGDLEGTLEVDEHKLIIGPNATIRANLKAREIVVLGTIHGNVEAAEKIEIRKEAKLVGDLRTSRLIVEDGAYFKGSIEIVRTLPHIAVLGSREADAADARSEQDIREGRFITLDDPKLLGRVLFKESDRHPKPQTATQPREGPTSASRGRH